MLKNIIIKPLILLLLLSQFATVVHAFEHDLIHKDREPCFVCLHQLNMDNALAEPSGTGNILFPDLERTPHHNQSIYLAVLFSLNNRGPPTTL